MIAPASPLTTFLRAPSIHWVSHAIRRSVAALLAFGACQAFTPAAAAQPTADDSALATLLFEQGRALLGDGKISEACQKFAESQRLDPSGGTLLNLALCHEREGKLASAWSEFKAAQLMARSAGRADREVEAANHVRALEPRLSRLTVVVPPSTQVPGLVVERDGRELGRGAWSTPIPIDGGEHVVRATALGREPFSARVVVAAEGDSRTVEIPVLATPVVVVTEPRVAPSMVDKPVDPQAFTPERLRWMGVAAAAVGVLGLGSGGYALAKALEAKSQSEADCYADGCGEHGLDRRRVAVARGNLATILGVSGAVLVGVGATIFYFGQRPESHRRDARVTARLLVGAGPDVVMTRIVGAF